MTEKDHTETHPKPTELNEEDLDQAQAGVLATGTATNSAKAANYRSRGNNVFGFEDLPNN